CTKNGLRVSVNRRSRWAASRSHGSALLQLPERSLRPQRTCFGHRAAEPVTVTGHGFDDAGARTELLTQRPHHGVDNVATAKALAPNLAQQILARDHVILSGVEVLNNVELELREGHTTPVENQRAGLLVEGRAVELRVDQARQLAQHTAGAEVENEGAERRIAALDSE